MIREILLGLDGSEGGGAVIELGLRLARRHGARVTGMGILDEPTICRPVAVPLGADSIKERRDKALLADAGRRIEAFLAEFEARRLAAGAAGGIERATGLPDEEIARRARSADLVVIDRETHFHFETDSVERDTLRRLTKSTPRPVIATPKAPSEGNRVLVAYDDSLPAARALQIFQLLGLWADSPVTVLSIGETREAVEARLRPASAFLEAHERKAEAEAVVTERHPAEIIKERAVALRPAVIVMGTHGHTGLQSLFHGSTTRGLLEPREEIEAPLFLHH